MSRRNPSTGSSPVAATAEISAIASTHVQQVANTMRQNIGAKPGKVHVPPFGHLTVLEYTHAMKEESDEMQFYYKHMLRELTACCSRLTSKSSEERLQDRHHRSVLVCKMTEIAGKQDAHNIGVLRKRVAMAMAADGLPRTDEHITNMIRSMLYPGDSRHPYQALLHTIHDPGFVSLQAKDLGLQYPDRQRNQPDRVWAMVLQKLPEPFRTIERIVEELVEQAAQVVHIRQELGHARCTVEHPPLPFSLPSLVVTEKDLHMPASTAEQQGVEQLQPAGDHQTTVNAIPTIRPTRDDSKFIGKGPMPFRGETADADGKGNHSWLGSKFSPSFDGCLYNVNPHGLRASFFDLNHHPEPRRQSADDAVFKTNKEFLDPDSKSHSTEEDLQEAGNSFGIYYDFKNTISGTTDITQKCILDCAPFTVETLPWDVMAAHYKTVSSSAVKSCVHILCFNSRCFVPIGKLAFAWQHLNGPGSHPVAMAVPEDPSVISIFSWNLSTVIKDLEQFQTSIATGTGLVTVPRLSAKLVRLRRIAAPLTLVAGLCLPPTDKFVYLEELSGANQTSRNPSNTETPLQRITSKVQLEALMRKTIRQLERGHVQTSELARVMKEAEITTFAPIIAFTSRSLVEYVGKQSKKQSKGQPAEDRTRTNSLVAVYKHCNEQIYHYHLPDKPQTVALNGSTSSQLAQVCSCDFIEIFPSGIAKAWHIATSEWLVCVTKDQTIGLRDLKDGFTLFFTSMPPEIGIIKTITAVETSHISPRQQHDGETGEAGTGNEAAVVKCRSRTGVLLVGSTKGRLATFRFTARQGSCLGFGTFNIGSDPWPRIDKGTITSIFPAGTAYPELVFCVYENHVVGVHSLHTGDLLHLFYGLDYQHLAALPAMTSCHGSLLMVRCLEAHAKHGFKLYDRREHERFTFVTTLNPSPFRAASDTLAYSTQNGFCLYNMRWVRQLDAYRKHSIADKRIGHAYQLNSKRTRQVAAAATDAVPLKGKVPRNSELTWKPLEEYFTSNVSRLRKLVEERRAKEEKKGKKKPVKIGG
ncbi:uncharacterized protein LOC135825945 isoform X2 [Sycon ciliatum]|uniref:uncharacterized protein LOC135825945 isoform X2 n=1 Tax=Sycon ciliatum TaxID=27933 RepID=UPI0031F69B90